MSICFKNRGSFLFFRITKYNVPCVPAGWENVIVVKGLVTPGFCATNFTVVK